LFRLLVPVAVAAVLALVWLRHKPQAVAWEMARDHDHCFAAKVLPAQVWAEDAESAEGNPSAPSAGSASLR